MMDPKPHSDTPEPIETHAPESTATRSPIWRYLGWAVSAVFFMALGALGYHVATGGDRVAAAEPAAGAVTLAVPATGEACTCLESLPRDLQGALAFPLVVQEIVPDSPAAVAGLLTGDRITAVDGEPLMWRDDLAALIQAKAPGDTVTLTVLRGEESLSLDATLAANESGTTYLGVQVSMEGPRLVTPDGDVPFAAPRFNLPRPERDDLRELLPDIQNGAGLIVVEVDAQSAAATAGLQRGDFITAVDGSAVETFEALRDIIRQHAPGDTIELTLLRDEAPTTVSVTLGAAPDDPTQAYLGVGVAAFQATTRDDLESRAPAPLPVG